MRGGPLEASTTEYSHDFLDRVDDITDAGGGHTYLAYDLGSRLLSLEDPSGNTTQWSYDTLNRVTMEENELEAVRSFWYDAGSNLVRTQDRNDRVIQYQFDSLHRQTAENWIEGGDPVPELSIDATTEGGPLSEVQRVGFTVMYAMGGNFTLSFGGYTTGNIAWNASANDVEVALAALSSIGSGNIAVSKLQNASNAQEWQLTFQGTLAGANQSQVTINTGGITPMFGPVTPIQATDQNGGSPQDEVQVVTLDNATAGVFRLAFGGQTTAELPYDADGDDVELALTDLNSIGDGNVSVTGSSGGPWTVTFSGDLAGLNVPLLQGDASTAQSGSVVNSIEYAWDAASQLTSAGDSFSSFAYLRDDLGRTTEETQTIDGLTPEIVMSSTWDLGSWRTSLGATIDGTPDFMNDYASDLLGRITEIVQHGQVDGNAVAAKRIDLAYNALSQFDTIDRYQSEDTSAFVANTVYGYDDGNFLSSILHMQGETVLAGYQFERDAMSRISSTDSELDGLIAYSFDAVSQLLTADHDTQDDEAHDWDPNGNPDGEDFDVGPANRLLEDADYLYEQDAEGNLTKRTEKATGNYILLDWDHRNRLLKVSFYDSEDNLLKTVENAYDLFNHWVRRTVDEDGPGEGPAVDTFFAGYNGLSPTLQFGGSETEDLTNRYTWGALLDQLLAVENVDSLVEEGSVLWPLGDQLGTLRDIATYNSGTEQTSVANHRVFNSSGLLISESDDGYSIIFGFTGKPLDASTCFMQFAARWYDPVTSRFMGEDPAQFLAGDTNLVRYVDNSLIDSTDPMGLYQKKSNRQVNGNWWDWYNPFILTKLGAISVQTLNYEAADNLAGAGYETPAEIFEIAGTLAGKGNDVANSLNPFILPSMANKVVWVNSTISLSGTVYGNAKSTGSGTMSAGAQAGAVVLASQVGTTEIEEVIAQKKLFTEEALTISESISNLQTANTKSVGAVLTVLGGKDAMFPGEAAGTISAGKTKSPSATNPTTSSPTSTQAPKTVYHQGDLSGGIDGTSSLSTSPSPDLTHYHPNGQLYEFHIPPEVYAKWYYDGLILPATDMHLPTGIITPELKIMPPASGEMGGFIVPKGG